MMPPLSTSYPPEVLLIGLGCFLAFLILIAILWCMYCKKSDQLRALTLESERQKADAKLKDDHIQECTAEIAKWKDENFHLKEQLNDIKHLQPQQIENDVFLTELSKKDAIISQLEKDKSILTNNFEQQKAIVKFKDENIRKCNADISKLKQTLLAAVSLRRSTEALLDKLKEAYNQQYSQLTGMAQTLDEFQVAKFNLDFEIDKIKIDLKQRENILAASEYSAKMQLKALDDLYQSVLDCMPKSEYYANWRSYDYSRIINMLRDNVHVVSIENIEACVKSENKANTYHTTLYDCTCEDFQHRKKKLGCQPCKHMFALAFSLGLIHFVADNETKQQVSSYIAKSQKKKIAAQSGKLPGKSDKEE